MMTSKRARARFPWAPALLVFVWIPLGAIASFSGPIATGNSGIFNLSNLNPITVNDWDVTTTPPKTTFNVSDGGYFVISSGVNLTSNFALPGLPGAGGAGAAGSGSLPPSGGSYGTPGNPPSTGWGSPSNGNGPQGFTIFGTNDPLAPVPSPVPEPSTVLLVGLGLAVIGMRNYAVRSH